MEGNGSSVGPSHSIYSLRFLTVAIVAIPAQWRAPDGRLHAVSVGDPRLLEGVFPGEGGRSIALVYGRELEQA